MTNYDLPFGYSKLDSVAGTVIRASINGFEVALDNDEHCTASRMRAFVRGQGEIGQRVLVSLISFNQKYESFGARLDGILDDKPSLEAAIAALAA